MAYSHLIRPRKWPSILNIRILLALVLSISSLIISSAANPVQAVKLKNSGVPHIVDNGVQMYEVSANESGGWPVRVRGDDTYGRGELLAVSVEFSEPVSVAGNTTFRIEIGTRTRDLVPVSHRDETVIFATLVRSSDNDSDGVWIGDNSSTLDHNDADAIQSVGDSPRNANLSHSRLGTQSNHKVNGSALRPKVTDVRIASTPQYGDTYVRNETIQIEARFDWPVRTSGHVSARISTEAFQQNVTRHATYSEGSGTSRILLDYTAVLDIDTDGIAIPRNSLARNGDLTLGVEGGGTIVGRSGGLRATLASRGRGEDSNHKIDARRVGAPDVLASAEWGWEGETDTDTPMPTPTDTPDSSSVQVNFEITSDPGHFSEDLVLILLLGYGAIGGDLFAFGLRTDVDKPGTDGNQGKGIIFNRWGTSDASDTRTTGDGWSRPGNFGGPFISVQRTYDWSKGYYTMRVAQDGDDDADGRWFGLWITDISSGVETKLGSLKFPLIGGNPPTIRTRTHDFSSLIALTGQNSINERDIPVFEVAVGLPDDPEGDPPHEATVGYSLLGRGIANTNVSSDSPTGRVIMRVGGTTSKETSAGTTLTGLETPQLTASAERVPSSHTGRQFVFRLHFSEEFPISYKRLRDSAFTVTGGEVVKASRVYRSSNMRWEIRIEPDGNGPVTVVLPITRDCSATGAICAEDGRKLSNELEVTVPGPGG